MKRHGVKRLIDLDTSSDEYKKDRFKLLLFLLVGFVKQFTRGDYRNVHATEEAFKVQGSGLHLDHREGSIYHR